MKELDDRVLIGHNSRPKQGHQRLMIAAAILLVSVLATACAKDSGAANDEASANAPAAGEHTSEGESSTSDGAGAKSEHSSSAGESGQGVAEQDEQMGPLPSDTPEVEKEIVLCLGTPPTSLFVYGDNSTAAVSLRHAIYENLYTSVGYEYQPQGLEKLPDLADGDAAVERVMVNEGERVSDAGEHVVVLREGVNVLNADGEIVAFNGTPIEMEQMVVDFQLKPMYWSDGTPITAQDSVYSFQLAADPVTTFAKDNVETTASYVATDQLTLRWTGIPGYRDQTYFLNVWEPVPRHILQGIDFNTLKTAAKVNRMPLASGPFIVSSWDSDGELVLVRNQQYYRHNEGLPATDRIVVRFGNIEDFLDGDSSRGCDVISNDALNMSNYPLLESAAAEDRWEVLSSPGTAYEQIAFAVNATNEYASRRPDWFEDKRVRQAITMCIDRPRMVAELTGGRGELLHAYVSENHRLFPQDAQKWSYDPDRANTLLDEAGYVDFAGDGRRQDVASGVPMTITLGTNSENPLRLNITGIVQENLADCGIPVETYDFPAGTWFAEGPAGRLFGRSFDLAELAWTAKVLPDCGLYLSDNITGPVEAGFGGWQNTNVTGWSNEEFDTACKSALEAMPGGEGYDDYQRGALRIFTDELPAVPLFTNVKFAAARPWIENLVLDPTQRSLLWNIGEWDVER